MAAGSKDKSERAARERARLYRARVEMHDQGIARRRRDNWIAGVVAGIIILGAIGGQFAYYTVGPGMPAPAPSPSVSPSPSLSPVPSATPTPESTESPEPSATPTP